MLEEVKAELGVSGLASFFVEIALLVGLDLLFAGSSGFKFLLLPSVAAVNFSVGLSMDLSIDFSVGLSVGLSAGLSIDFSIMFSVGLSIATSVKSQSVPITTYHQQTVTF